MNFEEKLQAKFEASQNNQGGGNFNEVERFKPKHDRLEIPKDQSEIYVRLLPLPHPGATYLQDVPWQEMRTVFLNNIKAFNGKLLKIVLLKFDPDNRDRLENAAYSWADNDMIERNNYGNKNLPTTTYLFNAVQIVHNPQTNQWEHMLDAQGNLKVQIVNLKKTAFDALGSIRQNKMLQPEQGNPLGVLTANSTYTLGIKINKTTSPNKYEVQAYQSAVLPPLPQGWESQLEDLRKEAEPTLVSDPSWAEAVMAMVEGRPNPNARANQENQDQQAPPAGNPYAQQQVQNQMPQGQTQQHTFVPDNGNRVTPFGTFNQTQTQQPQGQATPNTHQAQSVTADQLNANAYNQNQHNTVGNGITGTVTPSNQFTQSPAVEMDGAQGTIPTQPANTTTAPNANQPAQAANTQPPTGDMSAMQAKIDAMMHGNKK